MCHKECLLVNHKKYLRVKAGGGGGGGGEAGGGGGWGGGGGAVDERYVTLGGGVYRPALRSVTRGWGVSSFPEKSVKARSHRHRETRNEKRENCRPIKTQQLADCISRNEKT